MVQPFIRTGRPSNRGAFTLIELLVVIAIIALLAAILFPVFGRARDNARRSACQSNLKQVALAMVQYSQDYDETYPLAYGYDSAGVAVTSWDRAISPYLGFKVAPGTTSNPPSPLILHCINDTLARTTGNVPRTYALAGAYNSFTGLGFAGSEKSGPTRSEGRKLSEIPAPATTLMIAENPQSTNAFGQLTGTRVKNPDGQATSLKPTHFEAWNYLFADGHVKWMRPNQTVGTGTTTAPLGYWTLVEND